MDLITISSFSSSFCSSKSEESKGILSFGSEYGTGLCIDFDTGMAGFGNVGTSNEKLKGEE